VRAGAGEPYRLISLGLDSATYEQMVRIPGASDLVDLGPSQSGLREVQLRLDAHGPAPVYEALLGSGSESALRPLSGGGLTLLHGGGDAELVALLLPAVQQAREASIMEDGIFVIELAAAGDVAPADDGPLEFSGGVRVAAGDVKGFLGGNGEEAPPGAQLVVPVQSVAGFGAADDELVSDRIVLGRPPGGMPSWFDFEQPTWAAIDVRQPGGPILHRFRMAEAMPEPDDGLAITLAPAKAGYLKIGDIKGESRDGAAEAQMVEDSYPSYNGRSYLVARSHLEAIVDLWVGTAPPTLAGVEHQWKIEEGTKVAALHAALVHAAEHQGLVCQVALPETLSVAKALAARQGGGDEDPSRALATTYEALRALPVPVPGAQAAGSLQLSARLGAGAVVGAQSACRAMGEVGVLGGALGGDAGAAADLLASAAAIPSPRELDRAMIEWLELMDAIEAGIIDDEAAALAAAKAKADSLIESLDRHAEASAARWELIQALLEVTASR
jgi:hypothetical protein